MPSAEWEHTSEAYKEFRRDRLLDSDERKARRKDNAKEFRAKMSALGLK
jgi:hypothetical protein